MSWTSYIDNLKSDSNIEEAVIIGIENKNVYASSAGMEGLSAEEIQKLFQDNMSYFVCGKKYLKLQRDSDMLQMKAVEAESDGSKCNISVGWSKTCVVLGKGTKTAQGGNVCLAVCRIKDYLVNSNY